MLYYSYLMKIEDMPGITEPLILTLASIHLPIR